MDVDYNPEKLKELILYISNKARGWGAGFGKTKLVAILFYSDFAAYRELGGPITGVPYIRLDFGPYPDGLELAKHALVANGDAESDRTYGSASPLGQILPRRPVKAELFAADELAIVDRIMAWMQPMDATELSRLSHDEPGYMLTEPLAVIPYATAVVAKRTLTPDDIAHGQELAEKLGLLA